MIRNAKEIAYQKNSNKRPSKSKKNLFYWRLWS